MVLVVLSKLPEIVPDEIEIIMAPQDRHSFIKPSYRRLASQNLQATRPLKPKPGNSLGFG